MTKKKFTKKDVSRIVRSETLKNNGIIRKESFASKVQSIFDKDK